MDNVFADFLQNSGLYDEITITQENIHDLIALIAGKVRLDVYCKECGVNRIFAMAPMLCFLPSNMPSDNQYIIKPLAEVLQQIQNSQQLNKMCQSSPKSSTNWVWSTQVTDYYTNIISFPFVCTLNDQHHLNYVVTTNVQRMRKIGQYPSVADLTFPELDTYKKDISSNDRKELRRAIGLYAQGIGVGSYVYLRRVFERIIDKAKDYAIGDQKLNLDDYQKAKMDQKIQMLRGYLPAILTENKGIYGIISKGIHELAEEDCIEYFPILQEAIFMILRQWKQKREELESTKAITSKIAKIAEKVKE